MIYDHNLNLISDRAKKFADDLQKQCYEFAAKMIEEEDTPLMEILAISGLLMTKVDEGLSSAVFDAYK